MSDDSDAFARTVAGKAKRKLQATHAGPRFAWFGLGMFGVIGWTIAAPTLLGAMLGVWLDRHRPSSHSWTLALLVAGLVLGCANAWYWLAAQNAAIARESALDE